MKSSKSSLKRANKTSFKIISPFALFYQLTYMSAMAAAGISRSKTFELAEECQSPAAAYFKAINTLVNEFRYDYPEACKHVGQQAASDNMRSFLLRFSDALRSGEPLSEYLTREATVQGEDYENQYERSLEALKQWSNAFSSIVISVALIVIIQVISSMIYSLEQSVISGLVFTGVTMAMFGAWIIWRSAPQEVITVAPSKGSKEQRRALKMFRIIIPTLVAVDGILLMMGVELGYVLILSAIFMVPIGFVSLKSDGLTNKKDVEFSTFLRSTGGMATSTGTTLKESLTKIDLASFPTLNDDITRLSTRLQARIDPDLCWHAFGMESGSKLISEVVSIFYGAVKIGGDPERVGYLCSLFTSKTAQLRAKRRLTTGTFAGLTTVMQVVISGLMVFVLSIVLNFAVMVETLMPTNLDEVSSNGQTVNFTMASFSPEELSFLSSMTLVMIILLAVIGAAAIILSDGGYRLKVMLYLGLTILISGFSMIAVPPMVAGILTV